jgi:hypothetical protein
MWRRIKRFLPMSLYGRALLILILPLVILQLTTAYIFYDRHWSAVELPKQFGWQAPLEAGREPRHAHRSWRDPPIHESEPR